MTTDGDELASDSDLIQTVEVNLLSKATIALWTSSVNFPAVSIYETISSSDSIASKISKSNDLMM